MIYREYARSAGVMSCENLVEFLLNEQQEMITLAEAHKIIEKFEPDEKGERCPCGMSCFIHTFGSLVFSEASARSGGSQ